jgi:hypothetical protein
MDAALALGRHLNKFLPEQARRSEADWRNFFSQSAVGWSSDIAAFWIAISFWLQRQFDLSETIQSWLHRPYRENVLDPVLKRATPVCRDAREQCPCANASASGPDSIHGSLR